MSTGYIIYTDGGCDPNPGPGGWAALLICDGKLRELSGGEADSTNNRMELTAAIQALLAIPQGSRVELYTDSQYVKRGMEEWMAGWLAKNWRGSSGPVANQDLWKALLAASYGHQVNWHWVRGHTGNAYNERVDRLCNRARKKFKTVQSSSD